MEGWEQQQQQQKNKKHQPGSQPHVKHPENMFLVWPFFSLQKLPTNAHTHTLTYINSRGLLVHVLVVKHGVHKYITDGLTNI